MNLDDPKRLSAFRSGRIATTADPELTAIVHRVANPAEAPIALVSLVMDRVQYFRAAVGLPTELALASATNRCDSFCQFVVQEEALFVVEDAPNDRRVPQALVERYGVTAYAGAPLWVDGQVLGSLCVLDVKPRTFSAQFLDTLTRSASEASARLEQIASGANEPQRAPLETPDVRAAASSIVQQLTNMQAAANLGTPLMNTLAEIPRESWSVDLLGQHADQIGEAAAFYRALTRKLDRLQAAVQTLAYASASSGPQESTRRLTQDVYALGRNLAEGLAFVRVVEALADGALTAGETGRTLSVLHVALGFGSDLRASIEISLEEARRVATSLDSAGGTL